MIVGFRQFLDNTKLFLLHYFVSSSKHFIHALLQIKRDGCEVFLKTLEKELCSFSKKRQ